MRLILSAAVLALWATDTSAFSLNGQPRLSNRPTYSGLSAPSSLYMSTIERPMTAPNSPNSAGHPFGAYGKPRRDENGDDNSYSYGPPKTPPGTVDKNIRNSNPPADSFEAYMQGRNRGNPSSPSDNYFAREQRSAPSSNFGAPSTPAANTNNSNNNFGAPSNNFGAPSTPPPANNNNFGAPSSPATPTTGNSNNNSYSSSFGNPSTPPRTTTNNNFGAPSTPQTPAAPSTPTAGNNNNSFASFATGGNTSSSPPPPAPPAPGSFEAYMNSRQSQAPPSNGSTPPFPSSTNNQNQVPTTVSAAADPNSPLPPYMSPSSLESGNIKSANLPGSPPPSNDGRPNFQAPMPGMAPQQQTSTAGAQTSFREPTSTSGQIAPPITAPLAFTGAPQTDINPSQDLVGCLDQVLTKQREFDARLNTMDAKIDRTTQENIQRTQSMLNEFREDNKKTQETFLNRINSEVSGMKSSMDKVLQEQRDLQQKQNTQSASFANLEKAREEQSQKLLALEKTTSIRAQNLELNSNQEAKNQAQRLEALERNAMAGGGSPQPGGSSTFQIEQQQNERMAAFEQSQLERMAAFEDSQRRQLEDALRMHRESSQQQRNNNMGGGMNANPGYQQEQARMDETERQLQERLEQAQSRKEELLEQLREMQEQEEMNSRQGQFQQQRRSSPSSRFDDEEDEEEEPPKRRMMRDRLGKAGDEELYQPKGGRRSAGPMDGFDDEDDFDDRMDDRMRGMDREEERRMQHERMMRRDPVDPPEAMGGRRPQQRGRNAPGSPAGRYDPRRGRPSDDMMEDELAYGIGRDSSGMRESLGKMRSFKGDEQLPNKPFDEQGGMGPMGGSMGGMGRRGSPQQNRRAPPGQGDGGMRPPQQQSSARQRRAGLSEPPPPNPVVDQKIEHFLKEILTDGPKPHFDKELENLLMAKYSPLFSWLKPANASFLRNVLVTYLQHKGCQVEMDLKNASPRAAHEWDELLNILSFELNQRTGEEPRIMEEPDNQWGIYGSKNMRMRISRNNNNAQQDRQRSRGGGITQEEAARRKRRNDKAFSVSTDPTDPSTRLL